MNENTQIVPATPGNIVAKGDELEVSAFTPQEMLSANEALILWCQKKIAAVKSDAAELLSAYKQAVERKWKSSTLKRHADIASKRVTFYEKIKAALENGFYIVPNFPVDVFAIRTDRDKPLRKLTIGSYESGGWPFKQSPAMLPAGEGEYKPCDPLISTNKTTDGVAPNKKTTFIEEATGWGDIDFPLQMAKPKIMEATGRAMALKIFDQFGLFAAGTGDPIIVGEIIDPARPWSPQNAKRITFIIAWHLDTKTL